MAEDRKQYHYLVARINMASFNVAKVLLRSVFNDTENNSILSLSLLNLLKPHIKTFWVKFSDTNSAGSLLLTNTVLDLDRSNNNQVIYISEEETSNNQL